MSGHHGIVAAGLLVLSACQGGGETSVTSSTASASFTDLTSPAPSMIGLITVSSDGNPVYQQGQLSADGTRVTLGGQTGTLNPVTRTVTFPNGSVLRIADGSTEYVRLQRFDSASGSGFGIIGFPDQTGPVTGQATYSNPEGTQLTMTIGETELYELNGSMSASLNFDRGEINVVLSELDGIRLSSGNTSTPVYDVFTLELQSDLSRSGDFGGATNTTVSVRDSALGSQLQLSGSQDVFLTGGLFGPGQDEIGGVFAIDDTASGNVTMSGAFVGD